MQSSSVVCIFLLCCGVAHSMMMQAPMMEMAGGCSGKAVYEISMDFVWSAETHPTDYPSSAHWSPMAGTTHTSAYQMWDTAMLASPGVQSVAETGGTTTLSGEVTGCGDACGDFFRFPCDQFSGTCVSSGMVEVSSDKTLISAVSMIAPSPDWFVGIHDLDLCQAGEWMPFYTKALRAYDSGTDSGVTYLSANSVTSPPEGIFLMTGTDTVIYNPTLMEILPFGNVTITLMEVM
eukprot:TRINITY_DN22770_c0_g1_i1.p1 TRINITY_DN22770_c0_g1~~TRINITY_DN22770_c0_g1_i1.p1  ORF type:complete len:234 (-),score=51.49 TRINITY_DN22770_c0_g1_i1:265-966(-)